MLDKVWYFNIGDSVVRVAWPKNKMSKLLAILFGSLFIYDLLTGQMFGALLMGIFFAIQVVDIQ